MDRVTDVTLRLGLIAWWTPTGLGYQTRALHDHLHPARTLVIDLAARKGMPANREWFPDAMVTQGAPSDAEVGRFLDGLDVVFVCETPMNYGLFSQARERGIRTVLQANFEFLDYANDVSLPRPTVLALPSPWNRHRYDVGRFPHLWDLPVPTDPTGLPQRHITEAKTFLHVAGRPAIRDRNGTLDFIETARRCSDLGARWVLTTQAPHEYAQAVAGTPVEVVSGLPTPGDVYRDGDVLILPRRYGGLCLVASEALQTGLPVVMPDIDPNNTWLPAEWLVPAKPSGQFRAKTLIDCHNTDLDALEALVRRLWANPDLVTAWAGQARHIAQQWTWDALMPTYKTFLAATMELKP